MTLLLNFELNVLIRGHLGDRGQHNLRRRYELSPDGADGVITFHHELL